MWAGSCFAIYIYICIVTEHDQFSDHHISLASFFYTVKKYHFILCEISYIHGYVIPFELGIPISSKAGLPIPSTVGMTIPLCDDKEAPIG